MTRPLRVEYPGAFYHVYSRVNAGEKVFNGKRDKAKFLVKVTEKFSIRRKTKKYILYTWDVTLEFSFNRTNRDSAYFTIIDR